jgi:hypothetical protein
MSERDKFEAYMENAFSTNNLNQTAKGKYTSLRTGMMWNVWQAALAADPRRSVVDVEDAIVGYEVLGYNEYNDNSIDCMKWVLGQEDEDFDESVAKGRKLRTNTAAS